jgi:hypothetical protein
MSAFLPSGHDHAHSLSHGAASWLNRIRAQFTALRYFALNGTGPPQSQGTGQPVHHLANNHADDERLRQVVARANVAEAALAAQVQTRADDGPDFADHHPAPTILHTAELSHI